MIRIPRWLLAVAAALVAGQAMAQQITLYEHENFAGRSITTRETAADFRDVGFNDRASSVVVEGGPWEVCEDVRFHGRCMILRPGAYRSLADMAMNDRLSSARPVDHDARYDERRYAPPPVAAQIVLYQHEGFHGRSLVLAGDLGDLRQAGFNDVASSIVVFSHRWEVCEHRDFGGRCAILQPGRYPSLAAMGLNDRLSSVRRLHREHHDADDDDDRDRPLPPPVYDWHRRPHEQLFEVPVSWARAVYNAPQQRCWLEREQVMTQEHREPNVPGAIVGGVIGGILGHQVGGGSGRDIATVGGAVVGAAIGANTGNDTAVPTTRNVQRCASVPPQGRPAYWDVAYVFRGVEHHMQTTNRPGATVLVNEQGEPRL